jgi:hypothetical protein
VSGEARGRALDALATEMASGRLRRGKALKLMAAALVGSTLGSLGFGEPAAAVSDCKRSIGARCKADAGCCSGICDKGTCSGCRSLGGSCTDGSQCCRGNCSSGTCVASCLPPNATPCDPRTGFCLDVENPCGCGQVVELPGREQGFCFTFTNDPPIFCTTSCDCPPDQFCRPGLSGTPAQCVRGCTASSV